MRYQAVNALPLRNFVSIASGFLLFRVGCAQTLLCVLRQWPRCSAQEFCQYRLGLSSVSRRMRLDAFMRSPAVNALPLRNFVSIASGFLLFRVGCAQTLLCVLRQCPRCSAQKFCQYSIGFSSVLRRMCSDAFMRSALCVLRQ